MGHVVEQAARDERHDYGRCDLEYVGEAVAPEDLELPIVFSQLRNPCAEASRLASPFGARPDLRAE